MSSDVILFGRTQNAAQTPFDNSSNGFFSDNVQDAIEEAGSSFSFTLVPEGKTVTIPEGQEMVHGSDLMVLGNLMVEGSTFQVPEATDTGFGWTTIPGGIAVQVPVNRVLFYFSPFMVEGSLMVDGTLKEVA